MRSKSYAKRSAALAGIVLALALWQPAQATGPMTIAPPGTDPSLQCEVEASTAHIEGEHGVGLKCPIGTLRGFSDIEGGTEDPRKPGAIHLNLSAGDRRTGEGYVVVAPDVGKGLIVEDGRLHKLLLVRGRRHGGTEFRTPVRFRRGLTACDRRGCLNVAKALRALRK